MYKIYALKTGECQVPKKFAFYGYEGDGDAPFFLYVWVIKGENMVAVVDTGPKDLENMNKQAAHVMSKPIVRREEEELEKILPRAGVEFEDAKYLFITHMHYDHCSDADRFPNATVVVSRKGYERAKEDLRTKGVSWVPEGFMDYLERLKEEGKLILAEDGQEIVPGIRTYLFGGHSPCSMGVAVETQAGRALLTGDEIFLYENLERNIPIGIAEDRESARRSLDRIRELADIILPGHDPRVLKEFPEGVIG